jgi:hypothetical protein
MVTEKSVYILGAQKFLALSTFLVGTSNAFLNTHTLGRRFSGQGRSVFRRRRRQLHTTAFSDGRRRAEECIVICTELSVAMGVANSLVVLAGRLQKYRSFFA